MHGPGPKICLIFKVPGLNKSPLFCYGVIIELLTVFGWLHGNEARVSHGVTFCAKGLISAEHFQFAHSIFHLMCSKNTLSIWFCSKSYEASESKHLHIFKTCEESLGKNNIRTSTRRWERHTGGIESDSHVLTSLKHPTPHEILITHLTFSTLLQP